MRRIAPFFFELLLVALIALGIGARFAWVNWNQDANLHPDEYGLTNTLTQLALPNRLEGYFNTRISPLSPYRKYDLAGQALADGPDNGLRWGQLPMTLIRAAAEATGNTGYNELRLMGRHLSALADSLTVLLLFLAGRRLYGRRVGLLAAALSALAVLQIQLSHFMTVDTFAAMFSALAFYAAVQAAQEPPARRADSPFRDEPYRLNGRAVPWYALFGAALGLTVASRINLAPLAALIAAAAGLAVLNLRLRPSRDLARILAAAAVLLAGAALISLVTFRLAQPMTFRAETGDTYPWTVHINPDWMHNMQLAAQESRGIGGGPPQEQWAHRPLVFYPWMNMVVWGMGLPLGLAAWAGAVWALARFWRGPREASWAHALPLLWVWGYFLWMGTRWVASMRYFLPIYPFLALFAAWALVALFERARRAPQRVLAGALLAFVLAGTTAWAAAFVNAVYVTENTRIQASRWMIRNIPGPFQIQLLNEDGQVVGEPVPAPEGLFFHADSPFVYRFYAPASGPLQEVVIPRMFPAQDDSQSSQVQILIARDPAGEDVVDGVEFTLTADGASGAAVKQESARPTAPLLGATLSASTGTGLGLETGVRAAFRGASLERGGEYYFIARTRGAEDAYVTVYHPVVANESWDEGLPVLHFGYNPFGDLWRGVTMEVRWYDDLNKRQMFLENLSQADYIVLPSQRGIWSTSRLPRTYPMTMEYYEALFDGRLGFELVAQFDNPLVLGPLRVSDVGGTAAWNRDPDLPLFNYNLLAAEEAFSVYDHAPVWIFRKRADFSLEQARAVLEAADLSKVVVQHPSEADWDFSNVP